MTEVSGSKQTKQSLKPEQPATAWVDEPWQAEDDSCDVQDLKNTEELVEFVSLGLESALPLTLLVVL